MGLIILGGLEISSYFLLDISGLESHELFLFFWGLITLFVFIVNTFRMKTMDLTTFHRPDGHMHARSHFRERFIHNNFFISLQYLILFLLNVTAYVYLLMTNY